MPAVRDRLVRRRDLDLRRDVRRPAGSRRRRARARRAQGRPHRAHHVGVRRRALQDVRGDEALHAAAADAGAAFAVRVGTDRAHQRAARDTRSSCASKRAFPTIASRAPKRRGTRSRPATVRRARSPTASIPRSAPRSANDFIAFHAGVSRASSASACGASTGSPTACGCSRAPEQPSFSTVASIRRRHGHRSPAWTPFASHSIAA